MTDKRATAGDPASCAPWPDRCHQCGFHINSSRVGGKLKSSTLTLHKELRATVSGTWLQLATAPICNGGLSAVISCSEQACRAPRGWRAASSSQEYCEAPRPIRQTLAAPLSCLLHSYLPRRFLTLFLPAWQQQQWQLFTGP